MTAARDELAATVTAQLRDVPDFPQPGIVFKDIGPVLVDGTLLASVVDALADCARQVGPVEVVCGVEARGFILGAAVARQLGRGFVPVRKAGKLPPPTVRRAYELEYGTAEIEVPMGLLDGRRVYLVDDVLATGGTLAAARDVIAEAGGEVVGMGVLLELEFLRGRDQLAGLPLAALVRT